MGYMGTTALAELWAKVKDYVDSSSGSGAQTTWYGTSSTTASTAAKVVTCEGFTLTTGAIIGVLFSTANTAAVPTLNVNSTGAKTVYRGGSTALSATNPLKWSANTMVWFAYDGTYWRYMGAKAATGVSLPEGGGAWYGTCSTGATTAAKVVTCANMTLRPGTVLAVHSSTANTLAGAITLNVNSTGAKTVYVNGSATSSSNPLTWAAGTTLLFSYTGTYFYFLGSSRGSTVVTPKVTSGINIATIDGTAIYAPSYGVIDESDSWYVFNIGDLAVCMRDYTISSVAITSAWGSIYSSGSLTLPDFPIEYSEAPWTDVQLVRASGNAWVMRNPSGGSAPTTTNPGTFQLERGNSATLTNVTVRIIAIGTIY